MPQTQLVCGMLEPTENHLVDTVLAWAFISHGGPLSAGKLADWLGFSVISGC